MRAWLIKAAINVLLGFMAFCKWVFEEQKK